MNPQEDMAKLKAIDPSQKVWIGGLPPGGKTLGDS